MLPVDTHVGHDAAVAVEGGVEDQGAQALVGAHAVAGIR
jgi:hypothetical protein